MCSRQTVCEEKYRHFTRLIVAFRRKGGVREHRTCESQGRIFIVLALGRTK